MIQMMIQYPEYKLFLHSESAMIVIPPTMNFLGMKLKNMLGVTGYHAAAYLALVP